MIKNALGDMVGAAGDFLRRHLKSKAVREAEKRRQDRRKQLAWQKAKRASMLGGASAVGAFGYAMTVTPMAMAAVAAGAAAVVGMAASGLWQGRKPATFSREELAALPCQAEEWLLEQRLLLPDSVSPTLDAILVNLGDLPGHLAEADPRSTLAWDARKLIGEHLPNLVEAWCKLPAVTRERDPETRRRFEDGLGTIAEEIARLTEEASRDERMRVETHGRFLDARYRDGLSDP
ncbi:hypothetical protein [Sphingosinicella sp. BN140058]|uniref:hypothetical protein n=1 Tax=Sphingosinicella sp. BN140058 TaxID=1892855 RepID=UPI001011DF62|nr:hypothetical protein [Sphingosinicella sp. BN140058]QAY75170.1 hypothetical protein ETR14_00455 [Sphingosinicella sp. BN140058]